MVTQTKIPSLTVSNNPWWGHDPSNKQLARSLWPTRTARTCFTVALLALARPLIYSWPPSSTFTIPHYRALILRKTYADLSLPGAIMDRAIDWWDGVEGARFSHSDKTCYFPSGASVTFGYLASVRDHFRYQGAEVHFIGIDEASRAYAEGSYTLQGYADNEILALFKQARDS